jgi:hypothetical protein
MSDAPESAILPTPLLRAHCAVRSTSVAGLPAGRSTASAPAATTHATGRRPPNLLCGSQASARRHDSGWAQGGRRTQDRPAHPHP